MLSQSLPAHTADAYAALATLEPGTPCASSARAIGPYHSLHHSTARRWPWRINDGGGRCVPGQEGPVASSFCCLLD